VEAGGVCGPVYGSAVTRPSHILQVGYAAIYRLQACTFAASWYGSCKHVHQSV